LDPQSGKIVKAVRPPTVAADGNRPLAWRRAKPLSREDRKNLSMPTAKASVPTASANKYVQQLCKHWSHRLEVDLSDRKGVVRFPDAVATLEAGEDALLVTIEGENSEEVERLKGVVSSHLDRFAFREAPLPFDWSGPNAG
jgi:uncharacterized protein